MNGTPAAHASRQVQRHAMRHFIWRRYSHDMATRDEQGIIPRRIRRDIASIVFRREWKARRAPS